MKPRFISLQSAFSILLIVLGNSGLISQPGKNGSYTVTLPAEVLNKYAMVSTSLAAGTNSLPLIPGPSFVVCAGDLLMIYQAQGAGVDNSNTSTYGSILNYGSAGLYEFVYVQSVNGTTITTETNLSNSYSHVKSTQVILVPQYTSLTINTGAAVVSKPWKDSTVLGNSHRFGGLVVIHATTIVNNGLINVSGQGFRGGALFVNTGITLGQTAFRSSSSAQGGEKGESIAGYQTDYDSNNGRYCMGAPANGGGGGNGHNAGGGGGANAGNGNAWNGQGVMVVDPSNLLAAWALSAGYFANGNALTNSSGGGHGGYSYGDANANALTQGPGNAAWVGDYRREVGGTGGRPLTNISAESRIYFGGGGGAPHADNNATYAGTNGGGIVYLISGTGLSGTGSITANGMNSFNSVGCHCDGLPGAGAGGSIIIKAPNIIQAQIHATGGNGGSQQLPVFPSNINESEGPGGGGGGGYVALASGAAVPNVSGGLNGTTLSNAVAGEMTSNGATRGGSGLTGTVSLNFINYIGAIPQSTLSACAGSNVLLNGVNGGVTYFWSGPQNFFSASQNPSLSGVTSAANGAYTLVTTFSNACTSTAITNVIVNNSPTVTAQSNTPCAGGNLTLTAGGGFTYSWTGPGAFSSNTATTVISNPLAGNYSISVANTFGCVSSTVLAVSLIPTPSITVENRTICIGNQTQLSASGANTYSWSANAGTATTVVVSPTVTTIYTVTGSNLQNCSSTATLQVVVSECTGLDQLTVVSSVQVYPNPSDGNLQIRSNNEGDYFLFNQVGLLVSYLRFSENNQFTISLHKLSEGVYFLQEVNRTKGGKPVKIVVYKP